MDQQTVEFEGPLNKVARFLAEKEQELPRDWFMEVGVRVNDDGTYAVTYLSGPLTGNSYTRWTPGPGEAKLALEPCPDRGTTCPYSQTKCTDVDEVSCYCEQLIQKIQGLEFEGA